MRMAAAILFFLNLLLGGAAPVPQAAPQAPSPRFDAVSVRQIIPNHQTHGAGLAWIGLRDPSRWRADGQPLLFIVMSAYGLGQLEKARMVGMPGWTHTELFDIDARIP